MGSFIVWVLSAAAVALVVFGVVALLTGRAETMSPPVSDRRPNPLPADRPATPEDVRELHFDLAFRGYRMDEVDAALGQLVVELELRDDELAELRAKVGKKTP